MIYKGMELPDGLRPLAEQYIKSVLDRLDEDDRLDPLDAASYYMLASQFEIYLEARELTAEKGLTSISPTGLESVAPWVKVAKDSLTAVTRISQELGLTIRARKSISVLSNEAPDESPLQKFMKESAAMMP